jgi:hypothetical protein
MPKAVFAGCARSCAAFVDGVLANVEALGSTCDAFEVIIAFALTARTLRLAP